MLLIDGVLLFKLLICIIETFFYVQCFMGFSLKQSNFVFLSDFQLIL